ncbi:non-structural maintenance of chromosomes element 1 homolog isoform X1 [Mytilus galloprovincialis]|uniref:non-structural maintenance of chromosomes element 1 homolog isoform X1 n=1 Tax=Mytilus galloprovincialis TaxID=29158 RepID=UPI003F7BE927
MSMKDSHKLFLQSFMSRGLLDAKEVRQLYRTCCLKFNEKYAEKEEDQKAHLLEFVRTINRNIQPFHMEIKKGVSEEEGKSFYCLVCTSDTSITKLASDYTQPEMEFFKRLIESIIDSDNGEIGSTSAINSVDKLEKVNKKLSKQDAQTLLERLEAQKWIEISRGRVSLATRALLELEQYILEVYSNITDKCNVCKRLCVKGQSCDSCNTKLHFHCATRFFQNKENPRCPNKECGVNWAHEIPNKSTDVEMPSTQQESRKRKTRS